MIALDTNILVYAHREDSPFHKTAFRRVEELANGGVPWAIPWPCVHEFLGVVTRPRIFDPPTPLARALASMDAWLESPTLRLLAESGAHWAVLRATLSGGHVIGPRVHDARIVALCRQHGVRELWSADRDFSRFSGVSVVNPLVV